MSEFLDPEDNQLSERNVGLHIGERIRARRKEMGLSLRDLAKMTNLSPTFINNLERGIVNPTHASIRRIANALKLPIYQLMGEPPNHTPIVRYHRRARMTFPPGNVTYEIVTPQLTRDLVVFEVKARADAGNMVQQPLAEPSEECILVLAGRIEVCIAGETYELAAGDSIYFENRFLESVRALGDEEARYLSIISRPKR